MREALDPVAVDGVLVNARFYPHSLAGMRFARSRGLAPVVLDHGSAYLSLGTPVLDWAVRRYEDAVTALGRRWRPDYYGVSRRSVAWLSHFGIEARGVIPNAIDAAAWRSGASRRDFRAELGLARDAFLVAFVGRLVPEKGVRELLAALRDERLARRGACLVVAGDGPLADEVARERDARVRWVGPLGAADVSALLQQSDALCLPSRSEGFSSVLLEAAACGCPPVATDVGIAPDLADDDAGETLLATGEPDEIARALAALCDDGAAARGLGRRCRERAERLFSWDAALDALERAFEAAGGAGGSRPGSRGAGAGLCGSILDGS